MLQKTMFYVIFKFGILIVTPFIEVDILFQILNSQLTQFFTQ